MASQAPANIVPRVAMESCCVGNWLVGGCFPNRRTLKARMVAGQSGGNSDIGDGTYDVGADLLAGNLVVDDHVGGVGLE